MPEMTASSIPAALVGSLLTLYMMAILLRWVGPWLEIDMDQRRWQFLPKLVDPLVNLMRRSLPQMGPMDWGPIAAVMAVWIVRIVLVQY